MEPFSYASGNISNHIPTVIKAGGLKKRKTYRKKNKTRKKKSSKKKSRKKI